MFVIYSNFVVYYIQEAMMITTFPTVSRDELILMCQRQEFTYMRLRIINASPCELRCHGLQVEGGTPQGSWPYGTLFVILGQDDSPQQLYAVFGDLCIPVSHQEANVLTEIAHKGSESPLYWQI